MQEPATCAEYQAVMSHLLRRLGLQPFSTPPQAYRLRFGDETPAYFVCVADRWLEMRAPAGEAAGPALASAAPALLALQSSRQDGALHVIDVDEAEGKVSVVSRLLLADCRPDELIASLQTLRAFAAAARDIVENKPVAQPPPGKASLRSSTMASIGARKNAGMAGRIAVDRAASWKAGGGQ